MAEFGGKCDGNVRWTQQEQEMDAANIQGVSQSLGPLTYQVQQWCDSWFDCSASSVCGPATRVCRPTAGRLLRLVFVERYECERLLSTQYDNGTINPYSPKVDAAQLGNDCGFLEPFVIQRGGQEEEEDMVSQQLERSSRTRFLDCCKTPRVGTIVTEEAGNRTSMRYEFRGQASSREEQPRVLDVTECLRSRRECVSRCSLVVEELKVAEQFSSKVVIVDQDPVMWLGRDEPRLHFHRFTRAIRRARNRMLYRSHRPQVIVK